MKEYRLTVAKDKQFLFRTDWDADKHRFIVTCKEFVRAFPFPEWKVEILSRDTRQEYTPLGPATAEQIEEYFRWDLRCFLD